MTAQITVGQLIALLQKEDPSKLVFVEGCDCVGEAVGVECSNVDVLITRNP